MGGSSRGGKKTTQDSSPCPLPPIFGHFCLLDITYNAPALNPLLVPCPSMTWLPVPCQDLSCATLLARAGGQRSENTHDKTATTKNSRNNNSLRFLLFSRMWALLQVGWSRHFLFIKGGPAVQSRACFKERQYVPLHTIGAKALGSVIIPCKLVPKGHNILPWRVVYLSHCQW